MITQSTLRCFGGKLDGYSYKTNKYDLVGDLVKISIYSPISVANYNDGIIPDHLTMKNPIYLYRIDEICFGKDDNFYYLVPDGWTAKEALLYQFAK